MGSAALALTGLLLSLYLWLYKVGALGALACGDGACEQVQTSPYAQILGVPVAFVGVVGYLAMLVVAMIGSQPRFAERRWPTDVLLVLATGGVAFSAYLTYLEAAVIHAWCRWCLVSLAIIVGLFGTSLVGRLRWQTGSR